MCLLCGVVKLINKFLDKVLTLAAFVSVTSLSVHYAPIYLWELKQINDPPTFFIILQILFFFIMSSASILLFLELFSVKIKPVRNNVWTIFGDSWNCSYNALCLLWRTYIGCFCDCKNWRIFGILLKEY